MRIALLGVGLIGGSIGLAAREHVGAEVVGFDPDPGVLDAARGRGAVDAVANSVAGALEGAGACFACAPVGALPQLVAEALEAAPADCLVTDVGSAKRAVVAAISDERFIGGHPVAGSEAAGVENARADLFQAAYADEPFVELVSAPPGTSDVRETNRCRIFSSLDRRLAHSPTP